MLHKLKEYHRDLNRVAYPNSYVQPGALGILAHHLHRIGEHVGMPEAVDIHSEQSDYEGLCSNIYDRQEENDTRVRMVIEQDDNIKWASDKIRPIIKRLERVKIEEDEEEEDADR